jgi:dihydroorotase
MGNFIDKTFTVIADILLKILPASKQEKQAFSYYRAGMTANLEVDMQKHYKIIMKLFKLKKIRMIVVIHCIISV